MSEPEPRRALILAGGGLKVAFQAGVLQVWLDEAGIDFDLADGASGGVFNLAMWCTGKSGTEIADAWRNTRPLDFVVGQPSPLDRALVARTLQEEESCRRGASTGVASRGPTPPSTSTTSAPTSCRRRRPEEMNDDWLLACVSLPIWFPPVTIDGQTYVDAVFATDANLEAAIAAGADELWVIWTVNTAGRWRNNLLSEYFHIVENAAVSRLKEIEDANRRQQQCTRQRAAGRVRPAHRAQDPQRRRPTALPDGLQRRPNARGGRARRAARASLVRGERRPAPERAVSGSPGPDPPALHREDGRHDGVR